MLTPVSGIRGLLVHRVVPLAVASWAGTAGLGASGAPCRNGTRRARPGVPFVSCGRTPRSGASPEGGRRLPYGPLGRPNPVIPRSLRRPPRPARTRPGHAGRPWRDHAATSSGRPSGCLDDNRVGHRRFVSAADRGPVGPLRLFRGRLKRAQSVAPPMGQGGHLVGVRAGGTSGVTWQRGRAGSRRGSPARWRPPRRGRGFEA